MKRLALYTLLAVCALILPKSVLGQDGWVLNEYVTTSVDVPRYQFVELYNPEPNQSVDGLSIISVRSFSSVNFWTRHDLSGTADGHFYLVVAEAFDEDPYGIGGLPTPDEVVLDVDTEPSGFWLRRTFMEILLVNTADIPGDMEQGVDAFDGTEFNNGEDIIDLIYARDEGREISEEPGIFAPGDWTKFGEHANPFGMYRDGAEGDGVGEWKPMISLSGPSGTLPDEATPGAPNIEAPEEPEPADPGTETFALLNNTEPLDGDTTMTLTSHWQTRIFDPPPPHVADDAATAFPLAGDSRYLWWDSEVDSILEFVEPGGLLGTGDTIQMAFAIRVDNLHDSDNAFNNIDIIMAASNTQGSFSQLAGLRVFDGVLRMDTGNGWGEVILSEEAFDANSANNWDDGEWRVLAARITPSLEVGEPWAKWWVIDPMTGDVEVLADVDPLLDGDDEPRANIRLGEVRRVGFGAVTRAAQIPWQAAISLDEFSLYSLDEYPSESDFLGAVLEQYAGVPTTVEAWEIFH